MVVVGGSYHEVDSSETTFKIAAGMAFQDAAEKAGPVLLEPNMIVEIVTPDDYTGPVIGDLNSKRGVILRMEGCPGGQIIVANVPLSCMFGYATDLRSLSQGRATFSMQFDRYEIVPTVVSQEIVNRVTGG